VRGEARVTTFTERPEHVVAYGPLHAGPGGRVLDLAIVRIEANILIARFKGVIDRDAAAALRGTALCVPRAALPATGEETYYRHDLIGLAAETPDGVAVGVVGAVVNHGAGDVLELRRPGGGELPVAFTKAFVLAVDLAGRRVVIDPAALDEGEP
jgi:16S rRNA processing protein RimM